jgi:hypothetical protein
VTDPSLAKLLSEQRETLERLQWGAVADSVRVLSEAALTLSETAERLEGMRRSNLVAEEDLAREMGYVDEAGRVERKQFVQDMRRCGVERHKTSRARAFYLRDEVEAAIRRLGE